MWPKMSSENEEFENVTDFFAVNQSDFRFPSDACGRKLDLRFGNDLDDLQWITRISFPIFLALGTAGNVYGIFSGWIDNKHSQRVFVIGICSISLIYLWNQLIILLGMETWKLSVDDTNREAYAPFYIPTGGFFLYIDQLLYLASQWILLIFCLERCVAVTFPLFHYTKRRRCFGGLTVTIIFILAAMIGALSPALYYWNFSPKGSLEVNQPLRKLPQSMAVWKEVDTWWELVFSVAVYFIVICCNLLLVRSLQRNRRRRTLDSTTGLHSKDSSSCSNSSGPDKIVVNSKCAPSATRTQMLLASCLFYLMTQSLKVAMCVLVIVSRPPLCAFQITMPFLNAYDPFNFLLQNIFFAFEFVFLVWFGSTDRKRAHVICCS